MADKKQLKQAVKYYADQDPFKWSPDSLPKFESKKKEKAAPSPTPRAVLPPSERPMKPANYGKLDLPKYQVKKPLDSVGSKAGPSANANIDFAPPKKTAADKIAEGAARLKSGAAKVYDAMTAPSKKRERDKEQLSKPWAKGSKMEAFAKGAKSRFYGDD
jgi:hypothetical protein